jgi:hypothetical protein
MEVAVSIPQSSGRHYGNGGMMSGRSCSAAGRPPVAQAEPLEDRDLPDDARPSEDMIDESLKETFPASDPPSLARRARVGPPRRM